jgi:putative permease
MARVEPRAPASQARSLFLAGAGLLALYFLGLKQLSGTTNAVLLGFAGAVFAVMLDLPVGRLARRMPRPAAVVGVLLALGVATFFVARWILPELAHQFAMLGAQLPAGLDRLWSALRGSPALARALPERLDLARLGRSAFGHVLPFLSGALSLVGGIGVVVMVGAFLCADPEGDLRTLDALVPARHHERLHHAVRRSAEVLRSWTGGTVLSMAIVGVLTSIALGIIGIHGWLALGVLAFVGTVVPYLGSALVGVAIFAAGLADSPRRAILGVAAYAAVQVLLGAVIQPMVFRSTVRASPVLLLLFQFIMAASFGVLGVLLAQPLLAVLIVLLQASHGDERA